MSGFNFANNQSSSSQYSNFYAGAPPNSDNVVNSDFAFPSQNANVNSLQSGPHLPPGPSNPKNKNGIKLTIAPNDPMASSNPNYGNVGSLRNTPLTPSSALAVNHMNLGSAAGFNNVFYNQALQPPSNNDLLSPIHTQRPHAPQIPHLYNHHQRSSSSHLSGYSSFYSDNASPVNANFPPLSMNLQPQQLAPNSENVNPNTMPGNVIPQNISVENNSIQSGPPGVSGTLVNNPNFGNTWYSPNQSPSVRSPAKTIHKLAFNNSIFTFQNMPPHKEAQDPFFATQQQSPMTSNLGISSSQRVAPFNTQLLTHYENDPVNNALYQQIHPQQQQSHQMIPPSRAPAPPPVPAPYFADSSVSLKPQGAGHRRGQSLSGLLTKGSQFGLGNESIHTLPQLSSYSNYQSVNEYPASPSQRLEAPRIKSISSKDELTPVVNKMSKYRRASMGSEQVSPLKALTVAITTSYSLCRPEFNYQLSRNPRRVLTKPSEPKMNNNHDNVDSDYILYVNDVLGVEESRKYLVLDILGQGTFGQVVKCQNLSNKEILAVKVIKSNPAYMNQSLTEVTILETINNRIDPLDKHHFLRIKDRFMHKRHLCIAFELLSNNLYELIKQNQFNGLDMGLIKPFARQLLSSLIVLKTFKIIHCDLKPENILLVSPEKPDLKIIDFGSACYERQTVYTYIQSRFYRSPEVILGLPYTCAIDMWSFGCIIAELFLGLPLLPGSSEYNQLCRIIDIFGYPATWMIEMGKNSMNYLEKVPAYPSSTAFKDASINSQLGSGQENDTAFYKYKAKSMEKYSREYKVKEKATHNYFNSNDLLDIITNYYPKNPAAPVSTRPVPKKLSEKQLDDRLNLFHFLKGILNINPLERWTPQQAIAHPFVNNQPYNEHWTPPGLSSTKLSGSNLHHSSHGPGGTRQRLNNMHRRGQLSTSAIGNSGPRLSGSNLYMNNNLYANASPGQMGSDYYNHPPALDSPGPSNNDSISSFKFPLQ